MQYRWFGSSWSEGSSSRELTSVRTVSADQPQFVCGMTVTNFVASGAAALLLNSSTCGHLKQHERRLVKGADQVS